MSRVGTCPTADRRRSAARRDSDDCSCHRPPSSSPVRVPRPSAWPARCAESLPAAKALFDQAVGRPRLRPARRLRRTARPSGSTPPTSASRRSSSPASRPSNSSRRPSRTLLDDVVATAGLSLGEYTALVFAGAMSFDDGLRVVQARGRGDAGRRRRHARRHGQRARAGSCRRSRRWSPRRAAAGTLGDRQLPLPRQHGRLRRAARRSSELEQICRGRRAASAPSGWPSPGRSTPT